MPLFYHVQRDNVPAFKAGKTYTFGEQRNFFARDQFALDLKFPVAGVGEMTLDEIIRDFLDPATLNHHRKIRRKDFAGAEKGLLVYAAHVIRHQSKLLREFIFEEIRQQSFAQKPSRLTSIWLIPHDERELVAWCATATPGHFRVFELEATGNLHCGVGKYLRLANADPTVFRENARRYWSENVNLSANAHGPAQVEVLCSGTVEVQREIKVNGSKPSFVENLKRLVSR